MPTAQQLLPAINCVVASAFQHMQLLVRVHHVLRCCLPLSPSLLWLLSCLQERTVSITGTDCSSGFMKVQRPAKNDSSQLVPVEVPIGTIRASLGYLSTFEDCYALVDFLEITFKDGKTGRSVQ
jgi:hypothetical protein